MPEETSSSTLLKGLNTQQKEAIQTCHCPCLVLAGAGCGKTSVITRKIIWLLREEKIPSHRIAALTFTNKAANEMQSRLKASLHQSEWKNLSIGTFHSLGLKILRKYYHQIGLNSQFSLLDPQDVQKLIKEISDELKLYDPIQIRQIPYIISHYKNHHISPQQAIKPTFKCDFADPEIIDISNQVYWRYEEKMQAYNLLDFDDLLFKPLQLLNHNEAVKSDFGQRFQHILVDEYQDTNICQYQLLTQLIQPDPNSPLPDPQFTAVGDDNQSIYEWRGANPQNLNQLQEDFPHLKVIPLEQNYRSTNTILNASNALIEKNNSIIDKKLWSELGEGDPIQLKILSNNLEEANQITRLIASHHLMYQTSLEDYCILYRSNHQAELLEKNLKQLGLAYKVSGGTSLFHRAEIKTLLAYIKLMANPQDNVSFLRIINTPKREIGDKTIARLTTFAQNNALSLFEACNSPGLAGVFNEKTTQRLLYFHHQITQQRDALNEDIESGINHLITEIELFHWLRENAKHKQTADNQIERIKGLQQWLVNIKAKNEDYDLADIIHHLNLVERLEDQSASTQPTLNLMTIHAAKGLEFAYVYLIGLEEGSLPHYNNTDSEQGLAEERRLTYVAMTRAKKQLTLSYAKQKQTPKGNIKLMPSRFLKDIPSQCLQDPKQELTHAEKQRQKDFYRNRMKALFTKNKE